MASLSLFDRELCLYSARCFATKIFRGSSSWENRFSFRRCVVKFTLLATDIRGIPTMASTRGCFIWDTAPMADFSCLYHTFFTSWMLQLSIQIIPTQWMHVAIKPSISRIITCWRNPQFLYLCMRNSRYVPSNFTYKYPAKLYLPVDFLPMFYIVKLLVHL